MINWNSYKVPIKSPILLFSLLTFLTVMACKFSSTQTTISSVCKTGLAGSVVLARVFYTCVLRKKQTADDIIHTSTPVNKRHQSVNGISNSNSKLKLTWTPRIAGYFNNRSSQRNEVAFALTYTVNLSGNVPARSAKTHQEESPFFFSFGAVNTDPMVV